MENVKPIVKQVMKIWRLYKTQQLMLKAAMRQEIPFHLRKSLSRDYMVCSLLKKEMANFYDALKCCMVDRCIMRPQGNPVYMVDKKSNLTTALIKIQAVHHQIITEYRALLDMAESSEINTRILHHHQTQMDRMSGELAAQISESRTEGIKKGPGQHPEPFEYLT